MLKNWPIVATAVAFIVVAASAWADGNGGLDELDRLLNPESASAPLIRQIKDDGALRLTSNKDEILRLDRDAASVIVNNPEHASIMLDSPRLLIIMPRIPGATSFTVLDAQGEIILHKDVIVTNVQPKYVRIRKMCDGNDASCQPASYYYCPDGCYEVTPVGMPTDASSIPAPAGAAANAAEAAASMSGQQPAAESTNESEPPMNSNGEPGTVP